jgi:hypothetical protein
MMGFKRFRGRGFLELVVDNAAMPDTDGIAAVYNRVIPGVPVRQHAVWLPMEPTPVQMMRIHQGLPSYLQQSGLMLAYDEEQDCFWIFFTGGDAAPEEMNEALERAGLSSTVCRVNAPREKAFITEYAKLSALV